MIDNIFKKEQYSIINLYGLLPFNPPTMITNFISTNILSITLTFLYYINNSLQGKYMSNDSPMKGMFSNDLLFFIITNIFLPLTVTRNLTSCFLISIIIILTINNLFRLALEKYFEKKYI